MTPGDPAAGGDAADGARALVVFESVFGNSRRVAEAVSRGLRTRLTVDLVPVDSAATTVPDGVGLLVVGGPTHVMGLSRASTREEAGRKFPQEAQPPTEGLREWLDDLQGVRGLPVAVFDTRIRTPVPLGSAARAASRRLRKLGFDVVAVDGFHVGGTTGPLEDGELARAESWGRSLSERVPHPV